MRSSEIQHSSPRLRDFVLNRVLRNPPLSLGSSEILRCVPAPPKSSAACRLRPNATKSRGRQQYFHIRWYRRFDGDATPRRWMRERRAPCVQRVSWIIAERDGGRRIDDVRPPLVAVYAVADDRPSARRKVHADLMSPAGDEAAAEQRH